MKGKEVEIIGIGVLFSTLLMAVVTDVQSRKIPNALVLVGLFAGITFHVIAEPGKGVFDVPVGAMGVLSALGGIAVGFAALFPFYLLHAMGAGDVKLMMVVGAFLGPQQTFGAVVLTFTAGGVLALAMALWQRSFAQLAVNLRFMLTSSTVRMAGGDSPRFEPLAHTAGRMPYAVAIAAGTLLQLALARSGGWALS